MIGEVPWSDITVERVEPETVHVLYRITLTHVPTGLVVSEMGPWPWRLKTDLHDKLTKMVWERMDETDEQDV